jgi:hypothetical protein
MKISIKLNSDYTLTDLPTDTAARLGDLLRTVSAQRCAPGLLCTVTLSSILFMITGRGECTGTAYTRKAFGLKAVLGMGFVCQGVDNVHAFAVFPAAMGPLSM